MEAVAFGLVICVRRTVDTRGPCGPSGNELFHYRLLSHRVRQSSFGDSEDLPDSHTAAARLSLEFRVDPRQHTLRHMSSRHNAEAVVGVDLQSGDVRRWLAWIVDSSDDAIISKNLDGVILTWNAAARRLFGYSEDEMVGQPMTRIVPGELQDEGQEMLARLRRGERIERYQTRRITRDGRCLDVAITASAVRSEDGTIIGVSKIIRNITEVKQAESALRESEERFRLIANLAPVTIWMTDPQANCTFLNQPRQVFTGRPLDSALGRGWVDDLHPEDAQRSWDLFITAFNRREPFRTEYRVRRHDGAYRWFVATGVPRHHSDGSFAGYIGSALDIDDRRQAEEVLSTINQRLIEAQEEERARLALELHDDINQRLALLNVRLTTLTEAVPHATDTRTKIEEARNDVVRILKDIQALSHRLHPPRLEYLGIAVSAAALCREVSLQQPVEVGFRAESVPDGLPKRIAVCLYRVLQEALQNAIKHSFASRVDVLLRGSGDSLELTVRDGGVGFDRDETQGGLGLTSMQERLKALDGEIVIESCRGQGTLIRARVPLP